jgi:hypothetical protein
MSALTQKADLSTFGFNLINNARNLCSDLVENAGRTNAGQVLSIRDGYANAHLSLVLKVRSNLDSSVYDLIFEAVPNDGMIEINALGSDPSYCYFTSQDCAGNNRHQPVLTVVSEIIEGVEKVIPSLVRIEASKQRLDFLGAVFASTPHAIVEIGGSLPKRERSIVGFQETRFQTEGGEGGMIQGCTQMLNDFCGQDIPSHRKPIGDCELMDYMRFLRIKLGRVAWWVFIEEGFKLTYEVIEQFFCPTNPQFSTLKRINWQRDHDKTRSQTVRRHQDANGRTSTAAP